MSVKQGGNTIAGGGTVDQTFDGTSTNAQSGTAVAGAISNMATTDTAQTITGFKTISNDGSSSDNAQLDLEATNIDVSSAPANAQYSGVLVKDVNGKRVGKFEVNQRTDGSIRTALASTNYVGGNAVGQQIWVATATDGTAQSYAPACTNTNSIVTQISRSVGEGEVVFGFGNGLKIATKTLGLTGGSDTTWNYGVTFTGKPVVTVCRHSGANTTTAADIWVRGTVGTSSCNVYSPSNTTAMLIAVGY